MRKKMLILHRNDSVDKHWWNVLEADHNSLGAAFVRHVGDKLRRKFGLPEFPPVVEIHDRGNFPVRELNLDRRVRMHGKASLGRRHRLTPAPPPAPYPPLAPPPPPPPPPPTRLPAARL